MSTQLQLRRGTAAQWTAANPTLAAGEFALETDTTKAKFGDGVTAWTSLAYANLAPAAVTALAAVGSAPNANAATISNNTLNLQPASTAYPGVMSALQYAIVAALGLTVGLLVTANPYSNLKCDGVTDDTAALNSLITNAPDGSTLIWPGLNTTTVLSSAISIPAGKHFVFQGGGAGKTYLLQTSPTADHFTCGDWYSTFQGFTFTTNNTTTTAAQALTSGTALTVAAINTALVAASGTCYVNSATGWQALTYSARTATTVTLSQTGTGSCVAGYPIVFKTAGNAVNAGNLVGINVTNCAFQYCYNAYYCSGSTANQSTISQNSCLNTINYNFWVDGANWNGIISDNTCDCTVYSRTAAHLLITQCGSITGRGNQFIRAQFPLLLGSTTVAYPAGVFGVYLSETYFDNAGTDAVRVQGISAVQRVKISNSWLSSAQNGSGLNFASTAATLPSDFELTACNFYNNSQYGITGSGIQDYRILGGEIAGNPTAGVNISAAASGVTSAQLLGTRIGPTGGIGANGTGVIVATGTYAAVMIRDCDAVGNTTAALTIGTVTCANWTRFAITDNPGINPRSITTPAVPATTVTATNTTGANVIAYVKFTVAPTVLTVNGVSVVLPIIQVISVRLPPGGTISYTDGTAPTWTWVGD